MALLDRFFDCVASPIAEQGGEVLRFIGDAVLAIFPVETSGRGEACRRALAAASDALGRLEGLTGKGAPVRAGVGLHVGEVLYGNVGASNRLDFTVIGPSVNETARVEAQCTALGEPLLMTGTFAAECGAPGLVSRGLHALKGVSEPRELFARPRWAA